MLFDFTIWGVPVSHQAKGPAVRRWQDKVANAAREAISEDDKVIHVDLSLIMIFFHSGELVADLDNLAKSTLDGMNVIAFGDDRQIAQLTLRRTSLEARDLTIEAPTPALASALQRAVEENRDFVYVRVDPPPDHTRLP
jgi:Holliday junction resolvase RusA-like endonuclease